MTVSPSFRLANREPGDEGSVGRPGGRAPGRYGGGACPGDLPHRLPSPACPPPVRGSSLLPVCLPRSEVSLTSLGSELQFYFL